MAYIVMATTNPNDQSMAGAVDEAKPWRMCSTAMATRNVLRAMRHGRTDYHVLARNDKGSNLESRLGLDEKDVPWQPNIVMAYKVMAYIVMAYIVMAYTVMAYIVMAYIVMAYTIMAG